MINAKRIHEESLGKGLIRSVDPLYLPLGASPYLRNMEYYRGSARRSTGLSPYSSGSLVGTIRHLGRYEKANGEVTLMCVTSSYVYKFVPMTGQWTQVASYAGSEHATAVSFQDLWILTDFSNPIKKFDGTTFTNLGGNPPLAKYLIPFFSHLVLAHVYAGGVSMPYRVQWSDTGNPEVWSGGNSGFVNLGDTPGAITGLAPSLDRLYVYKRDAIYEVAYVGYPDIFTFAEVTHRVGLLAPRSLCFYENVHFFLGTDNVYMFDGRELRALGTPILPFLFGPEAVAAPGTLERCLGTYVPELKEYWLLFPFLGKAYPETVLRYRVEDDSWWAIRLGKGYFKGATNYVRQGTPRWVDLQGRWVDQTWRWADLAVMGDAPVTLFGVDVDNTSYVWHVDPLVATFDGEYVEAFWMSGDRGGVTSRWLGVRLEAEGGGIVELTVSPDKGASWVWIGEREVPPTRMWLEWPLNLTSTTLRARFTFKDGPVTLGRLEFVASPKVR